jgi:hypothetical protein
MMDLKDLAFIKEIDNTEWIRSEMNLLKKIKNSLLLKYLKANSEDKATLIKETSTSNL